MQQQPTEEVVEEALPEEPVESQSVDDKEIDPSQPDEAGPPAMDVHVDAVSDNAPAPLQNKAPILAPSKRLGIAVGQPKEVRLAPIDLRQIKADDEHNAETGKVARYGVGRDIDVRAADGQWIALQQAGRIWTADVVSPDAVGLRLHFTNLNMPRGAELAVYSVDHPDALAGPYEGMGLLGTGEFWTPTRYGDRIRIEYFVPAGALGIGADAPTFIIDRIQHIYLNPSAGPGDEEGPAGPCHNDVTCFPAWDTEKRASAGIGFIGTDALYCSGTMLNSQNFDLTPYFLTANHCLSSNGTANGSEIYWNYQTSVCNGAPPAIASVPQSAVTTLLSTNAASDYTLLMVEGTLPGGLAWAGWTAGGVADGTLCTCIHHPSGDFKRISFATKSSTLSCGGANHVRANWFSGPTEPGSSGSGLFRNDTGWLFGQLHCGPSSCASITNDQYGAFSATYPNIASFLTGGSDDGLEDDDTCGSGAVVTTGFFPNLIVKSTDDDWYRITVAGGETLNASMSFTHAFGDIDMQLFDTCGGAAVASSTSTTNSESISFENTGGTNTFILHVYLFNDTRNRYNLTVNAGSPCGLPGSGNCCAEHGTAGCNNSGCCDFICLIDPFCCNNNWDNQCVDKADDFCTTCGGSPCGHPNAGNCCSDHGNAGCNNGDCCAAICAIDPYCCNVRWDGQCENEANDLCAPCIGNNGCPNAIDVSDGGVFHGSLDGAGNDGSADCGTSETNPDVWYSYTAPCNGTLVVTTCGTHDGPAVDQGTDTVLSLHSGCPGVIANQLICNNDNDTGSCGPLDVGVHRDSRVTRNMSAGQTVLIRVSKWSDSATGPFTLRVGLVPANNNCPNAVDVSDGGTFECSLSGATNDGSATCGTSATNADSWYRYTAPCSGTLKVTTCGSHDIHGPDTGMDTVLSLHSGCPGTSGNEIQCNDDWPFSVETDACSGTDVAVLRDSALAVGVVSGNTYWIRVSHWNTTTPGEFLLHVALTPPNDDCEDAITVVSGGTYACTINGATSDGDASCGSSTDNPDDWYVFTAPCAGILRVNTCGTHDAPGQDQGMDTVLSVHSGCVGTADNQIACNDDDDDPQTQCAGMDGGLRRDSAIETPLAAGQTVRIRVSHFNNNIRNGEYRLHVDFDDCPAPFIVHGSAMAGQTAPCSGFIDPLRESSNGVNLNQGVSQVRIRFSEPVFAIGGGAVTPASFIVNQTGGAAPPMVTVVNVSGNPVITLTLSRPITLRQWTTIRAHVQNAVGTHIQNLGNLGPGVNEPDRVDIGFLPADVNQSGNVSPLDLIAFKQVINFGTLPPNGCSSVAGHYVDIDRNAAINPLDLIAFKRLINNISPSTQSWSGVTMLNMRP